MISIQTHFSSYFYKFYFLNQTTVITIKVNKNFVFLEIEGKK